MSAPPFLICKFSGVARTATPVLGEHFSWVFSFFILPPSARLSRSVVYVYIRLIRIESSMMLQVALSLMKVIINVAGLATCSLQ